VPPECACANEIVASATKNKTIPLFMSSTPLGRRKLETSHATDYANSESRSHARTVRYLESKVIDALAISSTDAIHACQREKVAVSEDENV
jgi:hypothetical protein